MGSETPVTVTIPDGAAATASDIDTFRRFDVVSEDATDHYYFKNSTAAGGSANSPAHKKIMQEWRILEKNLPDSIYVRVYENRINLLRAAIVGAAGTPYNAGLFFFDVYFPQDYPNRPPFVYYRSFGYRINPNLYANGLVCLSLLNTWHGRKNQRWIPNESTILQVLLSIQALVLNEKPLFNEPGVGGGILGRAYWEKRSVAYSEDVFCLSCHTMIHLLHNPPMGFEHLVPAHFRARARHVLSACHAYILGHAKIGYYGAVVELPEGRPYVASGRFKTWMCRLYPSLLENFRAAGAAVGNFSAQIAPAPPTRPAAAEDKKVAKKKKPGAAGKMLRKLGKLFGLKKNKEKSEASKPAEAEPIQPVTA